MPHLTAALIRQLAKLVSHLAVLLSGSLLAMLADKVLVLAYSVTAGICFKQHCVLLDPFWPKAV